MTWITIRCDDCGHTCDTRDRTLIGQLCTWFNNPDCTGRYRRRWTPPAIALKGPGFHRNDYKDR